MFNILRKEIRGFLSTLIAYIVIVVFLTAVGLFLWVFPATNILDYGIASLDGLFTLAPWVLIFLISAISMRTFAEERKSGTIETLSTHPVTDWQIILGKYLAGLILVCFAILPTLLYYFTIYKLGSPVGNLDFGATLGSYLGLLFLGSCYLSIGIFSSVLTDNQIVSFILSTFLCFIAFAAFGEMSKFFDSGMVQYWVEWLGIDYHYESI
ncbi:MAG: ABC-2 type transport system permease protein, partial [Bacteroidia bacterium]